MREQHSVALSRKLSAVLDAEDGKPVTEVAKHYEVSRQSVYRWCRSYREYGALGLRERSRRPRRKPQRISPDTEALVCCIKYSHPDWGSTRLVQELTRLGVTKVPSLSSVQRTLRRNALNQ